MSAGTILRKPTLNALSLNERDDRHDSAIQDSPIRDSRPTTSSKPAMPTPEAEDLSVDPSIDPSVVPAIVVSDAAHASSSFQPIITDIPTGSLDNLFDPKNVKFSRRGSVLLGGSRASVKISRTPSSRSLGDKRPLSTALGSRLPILGMRLLSDDEEALSKRVRSMYEHGNESAADWVSVQEDDDEVQEQNDDKSRQDSVSLSPNDLSVLRRRAEARLATNGQASRFSTISTTSSVSGCKAKRISFIQREPAETAGGIEDWQDVESNDVDRYGFIRKTASRGSSGHSNVSTSKAGGGLHRVTTALQMASEAPRRQRTLRRAASSATKSPHRRTRSRQSATQTQSIASHHSGRASATAAASPLRFVSNRLPHNRERRVMEEAGDMLTVQPGLERRDKAGDETAASQVAHKKKEWEREEKWRKMGKVSRKDANGGGMVFDFDMRNSKLINRTWKGIPDRWRATAWWEFLSDSARKVGPSQPGGESEEELIKVFHEAQERSSADDVQIDVDMPRTISNHIMFRRRYRGGQRLLFRVLHAMSLFLPDPGYVQGMAAIAATLLCYYDEEKAFVMMTRLWRLRGMASIYTVGFEGLVETLEEFDKNWLRNGEVAQKLKELGIIPMTYATKWYLTLFNYSIPFPAQVRVWDVFMLLGHSDLDVLHAVAAALIDGMRETLLLDADFENAMKVTTSWIPIRDNDLLMRVARAEYRVKRKKAGKGV